MSNAMKAADDIKSLASRFRSIVEIADVLEKIGSLEQATRDAQSSKEKAQSESKKAADALASIMAEIDKAKSELAQEKALISKVESEAREKADSIILDAKETARKIFSDAKENESALLIEIRSHRDVIKTLQKEKVDIEGILSSIRKHIQEAKQKITEF